jgi:hypothetical protein
VATVGEKQATILYCDFKSDEKIMFSAWFAPFEIRVWVLVCAVLFILSIILAILNNSGLSSANFVVLGSLLRQVQPSRNTGIALGLLLLFDFVGLHLSWIYENSVTSSLIVPPAPKIIDDLVDLIQAGYKVEYIIDKNSNFDYEKFFSFPFILRNMSAKFKLADFEPLYNSVHFQRYANSSQKLAMYRFGTNSQNAVDLAKLKIGTQQHGCYSLKQPILKSFDMALFDTADREDLIGMVGLFREAGLIQWWTELDSYLNRLVLETGYFVKIPDKQYDYIILMNLSSLFIFWGVMMGFSVVMFCCMEIMKDKIL